MSRRLRLGVIVALVLTLVLLVSAIGVGWFVASLPDFGKFIEYGYLGPPERRQRVELPEHRFAIAFAEDWVVEERAGGSEEAERSGRREVLAARFAGDGPRCAVHVVAAEDAAAGEDPLRRWATDHTEEAEYGTFVEHDLPEEVMGTAFYDAAGSLMVGWSVPMSDRTTMLTCTLQDGVGPGPEGELAFHHGMFVWGMLPIVRSIEPLAAPAPSPTATGLVQGHRVETPSGLVLTFPQGWMLIGPSGADEETVIPSLGDLLARSLEPLVAPWLPSPTMTAVRHAQADGGQPSESCAVGAIPGWFYDEPLEQVVALMLGTRPEEEDAPLVTYLELPVGRVARADVHEDAVRESTYLLPSGQWLHLLVCRGPEGATTGWDAIAASIEHVIADG